MEDYTVTAYYKDSDGETQDIHQTVPANSSDEAAEWMDNYLRTEREVDPVGDIEVFPPGGDTPQLYPT